MKKLFRTVFVLVLVAAFVAGCGVPVAPATTPAASSGPPATWKEAGLKTPLADVRIRQALSYAINRQDIVSTFFEGKAEVATSLTAPGEWLASGLESYNYNPKKARELLREAGWPADYTLDVVYYYADQQTADLMKIIGEYWSDVGVKARFRKLEGDLNRQMWTPPADRVNGPSAVQWDLAYGAVAALAEDEFYSRFLSTATSNATLPRQEGLDELIAATQATTDTTARIKAFNEVQRAMNANVYQMPLYHQVAFVYTSDQLDTKGNKFGNEQFVYQKNILDWDTRRTDGCMYTNEGPVEFFEFPNVNPGGNTAEFIFDRLITCNPQLIPTEGELAQSYGFSDDQKTLKFVLRDGLLWHDNQPLTGEDVRFSIELYLKAPGTNAVATDTFSALQGAQAFVEGTADHISGITVDGSQITLQFATIPPNALTVFAQWPILPQHLLGGVDVNKVQQDAFWQHPIGCGPYRVEEVAMGNHCVLKRWDGYWQKGTGNVDSIYMYASTGETDPNLIKNAKAGNIDFAWGKSTDDAKAMEEIPSISTNVAKIRYTRLFYINQFPHPPSAQ